ncbi:hypothetical protein [Streptomyces sp. NPDC048603]|uniref:hypothetical protein n=1 Tax=Streptomyces sp. NPDC048603 TaxID=3365577 RepID=UPI003718BEA6
MNPKFRHPKSSGGRGRPRAFLAGPFLTDIAHGLGIHLETARKWVRDDRLTPQQINALKALHMRWC